MSVPPSAKILEGEFVFLYSPLERIAVYTEKLCSVCDFPACHAHRKLDKIFFNCLNNICLIRITAKQSFECPAEGWLRNNNHAVAADPKNSLGTSCLRILISNREGWVYYVIPTRFWSGSKHWLQCSDADQKNIGITGYWGWVGEFRR